MSTIHKPGAELGDRIRLMVEAIGTQVRAAEIAGVSDRQLRMYVKGESAPPFEVVARLADASGVDLNWAATGRGDARLPLARVDARRLGRLVDAIAGAYGAARVALPPSELGRLAAEEYQDMLQAGAIDEGEELAMVRLVAAKHRRLLATETPAVRKRGA